MTHIAVNHRQNAVDLAPSLLCAADIVRFWPPNRKEKEKHAHTDRN
jgi:hypothetical protein